MLSASYVQWSKLFVVLSSSFSFLFFLFFFNDTATTEIYTLSLHDALPISLPLKDYFQTNGIDPGNPAGSMDFTQQFQDIGLNYVRSHDFALSFDHSTIVGYVDTSYNPLDTAD